MEALHAEIQECPIIDNHAHNLLLPSLLGAQSLLAATSEAQGRALDDSKSTLAHLRAVQQLAETLKCRPTWDNVTAHIDVAQKLPDNAWAKQCFQGIATALIDDGLDKDTVHPVNWHDQLTPHPCKRIVRIEVLAQDLLVSALERRVERPSYEVCVRFQEAIRAALDDSNVAGFKSVICYRTGLQVPALSYPILDILDKHIASLPWEKIERLEDDRLNPVFVNLAAMAIQEHVGPRKPFQFHTGLGDKDIQLPFSSASHLQSLIEAYPKVPFVLLHASYPFTREAGYLASVYKNCYLDIGEVFPMVSKDGQEQVIRQALELCPTEKLCWSTDGHWFPETYLLAVRQIREGLQSVLGDNVKTGSLNIEQAIKCARDILYDTSNRLYDLKLPPLKAARASKNLVMDASDAGKSDLATFEAFLRRNPTVRYLHLQFLDYAAMRRGRVVPIKRVLEMLPNRKYVGIQRGTYRMLQNDSMAPGTVHQGEWVLKPCLDSLRTTPQPEMAAVQVEIQHDDGTELEHDPRTVFRRVLERAALRHGLQFQVGFEIEVIFMKPTYTSEGTKFQVANLAHGHIWSGGAAVESAAARGLIRDILAALEAAGVELEQYHSEGAKSQYEFILAPLPAMAAADNLIAARAAIASAADDHGLRATLVPKIIGQGFGTGAHIHMSMSPEDQHPSFYAGVLRHMRGVLAFAMSSTASYERMGDGLWSGGTWVCWGDQNREACLRRVKDSHWECKVVDGLAHPHLVLAAIIGAGLHGVAKGMKLPSANVEVNPGDLNAEQRASLGIKDRLPANLDEALEALQADTYLCETLGVETVKTFVDVKKTEAEILEGMEAEQRMNWLVERY